MGAVVCVASLEARRLEMRQAENRRIRLLLGRRFGDHEDYGLLLNLLDEYGTEPLVGIIRSEYDPQFAL